MGKYGAAGQATDITSRLRFACWITKATKTYSHYVPLYHICEMLPLETKLSGGKLLHQSDLRGGVFLGEMSCRHYDKKKCKEEHHSYKIGT
jgi:hypothetical protein